MWDGIVLWGVVSRVSSSQHSCVVLLKPFLFGLYYDYEVHLYSCMDTNTTQK